jgi:hypothetical protein
MHLRDRIQLFVELGKYMESDHDDWVSAKHKAYQENNWFEPEFINLAVKNIVSEFLDEQKLNSWTKHYGFPDENEKSLNVGLVMAGNIPLVGFHDFLSIFISGHKQTIKTSGKDHVIIEHLSDRLFSMSNEAKSLIHFAGMLKGCEAYIATGSNNSARYFDYYFGKYPNIIRHNRTSIAILGGNESASDLDKLADDVYLYFGLGCRNVTKIFVPHEYDFRDLLAAFKKYDWMATHHKYKNNYDYQLALHILNKKFYMTNSSIILTEDPSPFSPISVLHYEYYHDLGEITAFKPNDQEIQTMVGTNFTPFGMTQKPALSDYADGIDTLQFLHDLNQ